MPYVVRERRLWSFRGAFKFSVGAISGARWAHNRHSSMANQCQPLGTREMSGKVKGDSAPEWSHQKIMITDGKSAIHLLAGSSLRIQLCTIVTWVHTLVQTGLCAMPSHTGPNTACLTSHSSCACAFAFHSRKWLEEGVVNRAMGSWVTLQKQNHVSW
jgi:hypothetical protein